MRDAHAGRVHVQHQLQQLTHDAQLTAHVGRVTGGATEDERALEGGEDVVGEVVGVDRGDAGPGRDGPVAISFTLETDGRLPSGESLGAAIEAVDAATGGGVAYFLINCAHPTHFDSAFDPAAPWAWRIVGVRSTASTKSHAELDDGDPDDLAERCVALRQRLPNVTVLGGCCGTDVRHVTAMWQAWTT